VFGSLALAVGFFLCTAPVKEIPALYDHAPWLNDPFDTVISFMMFFVPLIAIFCGPRVLLCRRSEPLPASRVLDLLRGCRVILAGVSVTLVTEWISVVIGENREHWNAATWLQIGLLAAMSAAALAVIWELRCLRLPRVAGNGTDVGGAADALVIMCIGILVPFALRGHLWWLVGTNEATAGLTQLAELLVIFATAIFAVVYGAESGLRLHRDPAGR
jgi:hypothetical protein